jgi:N-acetylglucosaminyl-diphospho-decaprenol L-rhamnosyltransferase
LTEAPLISAVIVTYHTGPVLRQAIAGVMAQNLPIELCLVDNGNPPDVVAALQAMAQADSRIRFVTGHGNIGFGAACNIGARMAKSADLLFLNPDLVLAADAAEKLWRDKAGLAPPFMIGARLLNVDGTDQRGCRRALLTPATAFIEALHLGAFFPKARLNFDAEPAPERLSPIPAISGAFMFLSAESFWRIGGFDEGYFMHVEDLDFCLRFRRAGGEIFFAPEVTAVHFGATSEAATAFIEKHKARGFIRYFHRNFSDRYAAPLLWALDAAIWARAALKIGLGHLRADPGGRRS